MKKIIFNTDSLIMGGAEKLALQYAKELSKDYEVFLLINEDNGNERNVLKNEISKNVNYKFVVDKEIMEKLNQYRELKKIHKNNLWYKIMYNHFLKKRRNSYRDNIENILKNEKYDILIDFYCKIPVKLVCDNTISWIHLSLEELKRKQKNEYMEKFKKVKKVIVINDTMKKEYGKIFKNLESKVERIYNFFDLSEIEKLSLTDSSLTSNEKILLNQKYIVSCCRLDRQKDMDTLIRAFSDLKKIHKIEEKLYIIGDGDKRKELESLTKELSLEKEIIFLGTQKNPYIWMKNAELFVHSSHKEGFGMVLVEAMIVNGVVVSSDCPVGPKEILENGKSGILVEPQNINAMKEALLEILNNKNRQQELRENSVRRMFDFSIEKNYKELVRIIEE